MKGSFGHRNLGKGQGRRKRARRDARRVGREIPRRLLSYSLSSTTRPSPLIVTPCQSQRSSLSQFLLFFQFGPSVALYRTRSMSRSVASIVGDLWGFRRTEISATTANMGVAVAGVNLVESETSAGRLPWLRDDSKPPVQWDDRIKEPSYTCCRETICGVVTSPICGHLDHGSFPHAHKTTKENRATGSDKHALTLSADLHQNCRVCAIRYAANLHASANTHPRQRSCEDAPLNFCGVVREAMVR